MLTEESNIFIDGEFRAGRVAVDNGLISEIEISGAEKKGIPYLLPGFVDMHIHGSCMNDFLDAGESFAGVSKCLVQNGVTSFMPTLAAAPAESIKAAVAAFCRSSAEGADPFSLHLEGPWINPLMKGAQNEHFMRLPDVQELEEYLRASGGRIGLVTVAPELEHSKELVAYCLERSVRCSIGHTAATYEQALESFQWGIGIVNHSYNAMTGFHHRRPGVVGAMLLTRGITCELIADGIHVSPEAIELLVRNVGPQSIALITDGIMAQNAKDGEYNTTAFSFNVKGGVARLSDGSLAGSTLTMDGALRNMLRMTPLQLKDVVPMLTSVPCRALGLTDRGLMARGLRADMVVMDANLNVVETYVAGKRAFRRR